MNVLVDNKEAQEVMERLAQRIHNGGVAWRQTAITETPASRATSPEKFTVPGWWADLSVAAELPELPTGIISACRGARRPMSKSYGRDAAIATDDLLDAAKDEDARHWAAGLNVHVDTHDPVNQLAWHVLGDHIRRFPHGAVVGDLDQKLVTATLQALVKNTFAQDDAEKEQAAIHNFEREENTSEPWEQYVHPEADSRDWLGKLADRFDMNAIGARGHWARLRDAVLRSPTGSKVKNLDRMLLRDTLRRLHDHRRGE